MDFIDVADRVVRHDERTRDSAQDDQPSGMVVQSMEELAALARRQHLSEDAQIATILALDAMRQPRKGEDEEEQNKSVNIVGHIMQWVAKKVEKVVVRFIFNSIFKLVKWLVKEVIVGGLKLMVRWLIRPLIVEGLGFLVLNPEISIPLLLTGGLAVLGYGVYKKFFDKSASDADIQSSASLAEQAQSVAGRAVPPIAAGDAEGLHPLTQGQLLRQGVSSKAQSLQDLISRGEGTYDSVNLGKAHGYKAATVALENMTVAEVMAAQANGDFNAAGRYQIIKPTLAAAFKSMQLTGNEKFDADLQDRIFNNYLIGTKRKIIADYIAGRNDDINGAVLAASQEWASVAAPPGYRTQNGSLSDGATSYYTGTANNRASISAFEMATVLQQERNKTMGIPRWDTSVQPGVTSQTNQIANPQGQSSNSPTSSSNSSPANSTANIIRGPQQTLIALR